MPHHLNLQARLGRVKEGPHARDTVSLWPSVQICSKDRPQDNHHSRKFDYPAFGASPAESGLCVRWSSRKCTYARLIDRAVEMPLSDKQKDRQSSVRNDPVQVDQQVVTAL